VVATEVAAEGTVDATAGVAIDGADADVGALVAEAAGPSTTGMMASGAIGAPQRDRDALLVVAARDGRAAESSAAAEGGASTTPAGTEVESLRDLDSDSRERSRSRSRSRSRR
jgi:hypothetical protein